MADDRFAAVFSQLRDIMLSVVDEDLDVTRDEPGDLVVRTRSLDAKGQQGWFGTVTIKKSYVAFHLMALYERQALLESLEEPLAAHRHGKTCFNFKSGDRQAFVQLRELVSRMHSEVAGNREV
jgi:hypothetical protein